MRLIIPDEYLVYFLKKRPTTLIKEEALVRVTSKPSIEKQERCFQKNIDTNAHPIMILSAEGTSSILLKRELEVFRNLMLSLENVSEEEYYNKNILEKYKKI